MGTIGRAKGWLCLRPQCDSWRRPQHNSSVPFSYFRPPHRLLCPAGADVRAKGGFNGLWGSTLKEVSDKMAQFGGRLSLDEMDADAGQCTIALLYCAVFCCSVY
jgi:hypothetical protein